MEYYVHLADETLEKLEGVIAGVDIESVEFTENGEYTAPSGKAYGSVSVNVEGGGSSDFSTAKVTINSAVEVQPVNASIPVLYDDPDYSTIMACEVIHAGVKERTVVLYKGYADIFVPKNTIIDGDSYNLNIVISGAIEDIDDGYYVITGDCLITITLAGG